ncbi:hypothetical protein BJ742DRAFT_782339 [Cladochytrium replicatum]|nr:hypothetical protein BJ742DRAFT_782339 [Cladochytrium replicatum]
MSRTFVLLVVCCAVLVIANPVPNEAFTKEITAIPSNSRPITLLDSAKEPPAGAELCTVDYECGKGSCVKFGNYTSYCICQKNWKDDGRSACSYEQTSKLTAFLVSLFVGPLGVDWFLLSKGKASYIVAGVFKLLTGGGFGTWWLVDWIRILLDSFPDGNGVPVGEW